MNILKNVNIGILSKHKEGFTSMMRSFFESLGHSVEIFTEDNISIDYKFLDKDLYILKSKQLIYLYAAYYLEANKVRVIPDIKISNMFKNRIDSHFSLKLNGFLTPKVFMGTAKSIKKNLESKEYTLIQKPIMGSGSKGIRIIESSDDLDITQNGILYLEKYIEGDHYLVYFIEDELSICKKKPLANEHDEVQFIKRDEQIEKLVLDWMGKYHLAFGHLDLIREKDSNDLYLVDVGTFPEFSNWQGKYNKVEKIANIILNKYYSNLKN